MTQALGVTIRLFLADGTPDGLRVVEKSNWTGVGLVFARSDLAKVKDRAELSSTGVYVLIGPSEGGGLGTRIYVGEGDDVLTRLKYHQGDPTKDFWTRTVVFTAKDANLNKADVRYLESRLVQAAKEAKRAEVANSTTPARPPLSEPDIAEAEGFLREMLVIFPVLGLDAFEKAADLAGAPGGSSEYRIEWQGVTARGEERPEGFLVRAGSTSRAEEVESIPKNVTQLRATLLASGVMVADGGVIRFAEDYVFNSPSLAAAVVLGRSANGRVEWRDEAGVTLKDHQAATAPGAL